MYILVEDDPSAQEDSRRRRDMTGGCHPGRNRSATLSPQSRAAYGGKSMTPANRPARQGEVQTVLGPLAPEELGPTLMHEHVLCDLRHPSQRSQEALGPELALDNVWAINYGTVKRDARQHLLHPPANAAGQRKRT